MTQQFRIDSTALRDKINTLLPSQARGAIDVDLSGQTTIVPIVDLTETAEGSALRQDLQTALTHTNATSTHITSASFTTLVNTTGFYLVRLNTFIIFPTTDAVIRINDGTTTKIVAQYTGTASGTNYAQVPTVDEFIVKLSAGDSLEGSSGNASNTLNVTTRQIADLAGNLTNP